MILLRLELPDEICFFDIFFKSISSMVEGTIE